MRIAGSNSYQGFNFSIEEKELFRNAGAFFCQAIENAEGVPFQLIFGPQVGEGYYLDIGGGIIDLVGIEPGDFTERKFQSMIEMVIPAANDMPVDRELTRQKFLQGELKSYKAELLVKTPSGDKKWIRDASLPLFDENSGKIIGAFGILYDITEQRKATNSNCECLNDNDKLKSSFLRNISHEIRTPLNAIVGFSALIGEPGVRSDQVQEYRELISQSSDQLLEILNDIIEMSKIDAGLVTASRELVNINKVLSKIYTESGPAAVEKGITLKLQAPIDGDDLILKTDLTMLMKVLRNLVGNALKFTSEGSVEFGCVNGSRNIEFFITDTGIGIPREHHESLFNCFYQAESSVTRSYGGTGLGLAISKAYIELMGGKIWFTSSEGSGSQFRFTLPFDNTRVG